MESRFQHILLSFGLIASALFSSQQASAKTELDLNSEYFEIGASLGQLAIQDFTVETAYGVNATFHASEDFFLQINYMQAEAGLSSYEKSSGFGDTVIFGEDDRTFSHYDFLIGYNLLQGEFYPSEAKTILSRLYAVVGAGNVGFGGEQSFNTTLGVGYKVDLNRRWNIRIDYRDYIYRSKAQAEVSMLNNTHFSIGIGFIL